MNERKTIKAVLPVPPSANRYWRTTRNGRQYVSREATAYKWQVAAVLANTIPLDGDVRVSVTWYRARRSGDLDNRIKVFLDALEGYAYVDDSQIVEIHAKRSDDERDNPRIVVEVKAA